MRRDSLEKTNASHLDLARFLSNQMRERALHAVANLQPSFQRMIERRSGKGIGENGAHLKRRFGLAQKSALRRRGLALQKMRRDADAQVFVAPAVGHENGEEEAFFSKRGEKGIMSTRRLDRPGHGLPARGDKDESSLIVTTGDGVLAALFKSKAGTLCET